MNREEMAKILTYLSADTGSEISQAKLQVWFDAFKHLEVPQAWAAAKIYLHRGMFSGPRVSEFSAVIEELTATSRAVPAVDQAFEQACIAVRKYGYYRPDAGLASAHPAVRQALKVIGWAEFCTSDNPPALRAHFRQVYEMIAKRESRNAGMAPQLRLLLDTSARNEDDETREIKKIATG